MARRILIVEDDTLLNEAYRVILEAEGHKVTTAFNGEEGLKKAQASDPEIILLDLLMPHMDGLEFLRRYQPNQDTSKAKVIVLTNLDQDKQIQEALQLGAMKYILKASTSPRQLAVQVNHFIKKHFEKNEAQI